MLHRASDLAEGVQELGYEKNIWAWEGVSYRDFRKVRNERCRDLYSSSNNWMIKAKRMTWTVQENESTMILQNISLYWMIQCHLHSRTLETSYTVYFYQKSLHRKDSRMQHVTYLRMVAKYFTVYKYGDKLSEFPCCVKMTVNLKLCHNTINCTTDRMAIHRQKVMVPQIRERILLTQVKILFPLLKKRVTHSDGYKGL